MIDLKILKGLKPEKVFEYFEAISAIPRGSGNTEKIREYCACFAKWRNLKYICDDSGNIIIFKDACNSESTEPVIIQGHLDMVWEKNDECNINFETDGLELCVDGDFVHAKGTTLGSDDGIAVAMGLALLDSNDISHPPLEIVFTSDEEVGMTGANGIDCSVLKGKRMINLDSEAEGTLWVSCAGGVRADIGFPVEYTDNINPVYGILVSDLHGGHSGAEIHKGYRNANKILGKILSVLKQKIDFNIVDIGGGTVDNAITRSAFCVFSTADDIKSVFDKVANDICDEIKDTDPDAEFVIRKIENTDKCMNSVSTDGIINLLNNLPSGVIAMSKEIEGLVETSLNLGVMKHTDSFFNCVFSVRSGVDGEKDKLCAALEKIAYDNSASIIFYSSYPAWEFKKDSPLRDMMAKIYKDMFGKDMTVTAIHAGLECGLFCGKIKGLDCVSFGPDIFDIHSPSEKLSVSSTERTWNYLLKVLGTI